MASPELDLREMEALRKSAEGRDVLGSAGFSLNRSVAVLAVGHHLASRRGAAPSEVLGAALEPWIDPNDSPNVRERYEISFGRVLGPVMQLALTLNRSPGDTAIDITLPSWFRPVGIEWYLQFLQAGAQILQTPNALPPIA